MNLWPGLFLQSIMLCFLATYLLHDGTQAFLAKVGGIKQELGYTFAFLSFMLSGALLPELMRIVFFQGWKPRWENLWNFALTGPFIGFMGVIVDFFYRCQNAWFGVGNDWGTLITKVLVDQLFYSPLLANLLCTIFFTLRDGRFSREVFASIFTLGFMTEKFLPVQIAGWAFWFPAVACIYFMPPQLQIPFAVLVQTFWVLMVTTITERQARTACG